MASWTKKSKGLKGFLQSPGFLTGGFLRATPNWAKKTAASSSWTKQTKAS